MVFGKGSNVALPKGIQSKDFDNTVRGIKNQAWDITYPACVGYGLMREADFNRRWIDMDAAGTIYDHYGIEIDEIGSAYDPQGVFELE